MKKKVSLVLSVILLFLLAIPVNALDANSKLSQSLRFSYIWSMGASLDINSAGRASCEGFVDASSDEYTANVTVTLQQKSNNVWTNVTSWTGSGSGQSGFFVVGAYYVGSGTYRVRTTAKIYNSSETLLETASIYSAEKTY